MILEISAITTPQKLLRFIIYRRLVQSINTLNQNTSFKNKSKQTAKNTTEAREAG